MAFLVQVVPGVPFFASKVLLGPQGVAKVLGVGEMDAFEKDAFEKMLPELKSQIQKGEWDACLSSIFQGCADCNLLHYWGRGCDCSASPAILCVIAGVDLSICVGAGVEFAVNPPAPAPAPTA